MKGTQGSMSRFLSEQLQHHVHQQEVMMLTEMTIGLKLIAEAGHGYDAWSRVKFMAGFKVVADHIRKCYRHGRSAERFESVSDMWDTHKRSAEYLDKLAKAFEDGTATISDSMIQECERIRHEIDGCTESLVKY